MKIFLLGISLLTISLSFVLENGSQSGQNGMLSGVVTYKESYDMQDKADAGGEIFAFNEDDIRTTNYDNITAVIDNFLRNKANFSLATFSTLDVSKIIKAQDIFDAQSKFAGSYIGGFRKIPAIAKASVNNEGNYSLELKPGRYVILFVSGSVKSNNEVESRGNIDYKIVDIKPDGRTQADVNFEKIQNILILMMTSGKQQGC